MHSRNKCAGLGVDDHVRSDPALALQAARILLLTLEFKVAAILPTDPAPPMAAERQASAWVMP
jgi:hypothetical protein